MRELLGSFIRSFHKAIRGEMDAMRKRLGPFEVPLKGARRADASADGDHVYLFVHQFRSGCIDRRMSPGGLLPVVLTRLVAADGSPLAA